MSKQMDLLQRLATWDDCAAVLKRLYSELAKRLTCKEILPELYSLDAITEYEKREVEDASHSTEITRNQKILDFLLKKRKHEFDLFLQALRLVSRHDLSSLMYDALKEQLHVHRWVVVTSLDTQSEIPEELVVLYLEDEIKVPVERYWKLSSDSVVVCFCEDKGRRKALETTTFAHENLHVRIEELSILKLSDDSIRESTARAAVGILNREEMADVVPVHRWDSTLSEPAASSAAPSSLPILRNQHPDFLADTVDCDSARLLKQEMACTVASFRGLPCESRYCSSETELVCPTSGLDFPDATSCAEAGAGSATAGGATTISVDCQASKETCSTMLPQCTQPQTVAYDDRHAGNPLATNKRSPGSAEKSGPFARLVFGRHRAASQCLHGQSKEFLSLLKAYKCSVPGPQTDWGGLLVLEYNEPFTLPGQEARLSCIAAAIDEFFCSRDDS